MGKRFLIAVDYSKNATRAVEFVANTFSKDHKIDLLSILPKLPPICDIGAESFVPSFEAERRAMCGMEYEQEAALKEALKRAKEILVNAGFPEDNIETHPKKQKDGVARDIVSEANRLNVDMIVMGRRGLSAIKEFFIGSVSQKVIQLAKNKSVLLVQ